jgi:hypothetical protein
MNLEKLFREKDNMILMLREKKDLHIHLNLVQILMVNGLEVLETVSEYNNGLMVLDMKVLGKIIEHTARVNLPILTVIFMMENGIMIKLMDMVFIII